MVVGFRRNTTVNSVALLEAPEHGHEQVDREQPDEDDLPEPQVARRPMVRRHLRVPIEKPFSGF